MFKDGRFYTAFLMTLGILFMVFAVGIAFYNTYYMVHGQLTIPQYQINFSAVGAFLYRFTPSWVKAATALIWELITYIF